MAATEDTARFDARWSARLERHRDRLLPVRIVAARPRLFLSFAAGALAGFFAPESLSLVTRSLIGWNVATLCDLALAVFTMGGGSHRGIRYRAQLLDDGRYFVLIFSAVAAIAAICAILVEMSAAKDMQGAARALHLSLAGLTILTSWLFMHMTFALHYAHEYYHEREKSGAIDCATPASVGDLDGDGDGDDDDAAQAEASSDTRGGLIFPDTTHPSYLDFAYFSYTIGVASQTADVSISSRAMRTIVLAHSVLSFFFNTTILALTINLAAGLF